jgi:hypothetical protein
VAVKWHDVNAPERLLDRCSGGATIVAIDRCEQRPIYFIELGGYVAVKNVTMAKPPDPHPH